MHAGEIVVRFLRIAGVILNLGASVLRQMAHGIGGRAATGGRAASIAWVRRSIADYG